MPCDYSKYPANWKVKSRFVRFVRAKNRCEWCGAKNYQPHPLTGSIVVLTVAHIWQDLKYSSLLDLAALCQRCHLNHDRPHHIRKRKQNKLKGQLKLF